MDMLSINLVAIFVHLFFAPIQISEAGWRGIIPLHSNRGDVEKLLGKSSSICGCSYNLQDFYIHFAYSTSKCQDREDWNVPPGTVLKIYVGLKKPLDYKELNVDITKYKSTSDPEVLDYTYYTNEELGTTIIRRNDRITGIFYKPSTKDVDLKCPGK
jgi:hypothetical protein